MKLFVIFLLNIPICIVLYIALLFTILRERIDDTFTNPWIILLLLLAVSVQVLIINRVLKYYDLRSRASLVVGMSGVLITWTLAIILIAH